MEHFELKVNSQNVRVEASGDMPLLWVLRDKLNLCGTKYGCGVGVCGACVVLVGDFAARACMIPLKQVAGKYVLTIEGLSKNGDHPLQRAWMELDVPQCGYCQAGQIMAAAALLRRKPKPTDADIDAAMHDVICRCGTYDRIRSAIKLAAQGAPKSEEEVPA